MNEDLLFREPVNLLPAPPAIVQEAFDEQALKREWDEACADEQDAVTRKQNVLRAALKRWPMVPSLRRGGNRMVYSPEMRRFVRDVLGMPDASAGSMNRGARMLLNEGAREKHSTLTSVRQHRNVQIKNAVIELTTKYKLGADPKTCMDRLTQFLEDIKNG